MVNLKTGDMKWQRLLHKKCPKCGEILDDAGKYFMCPKGNDCFFISKMKAAEILTDPGHAVQRHLAEDEKHQIETILKSFGVVTK